MVGSGQPIDGAGCLCRELLCFVTCVIEQTIQEFFCSLPGVTVQLLCFCEVLYNVCHGLARWLFVTSEPHLICDTLARNTSGHGVSSAAFD